MDKRIRLSFAKNSAVTSVNNNGLIKVFNGKIRPESASLSSGVALSLSMTKTAVIVQQ